MGTSNFRLGSSSIFIGFIILVMVFTTGTAGAQDVANGLATATILSALVVTATSPLAFGNTYQGVPKEVVRTVAEAGVFTISGVANAGITMYMYLPEYLSVVGDSDRMTISFRSTDCTVDTALAASPGDPTGGAIDGYIGIDPHNFPDGINLSDNGFCGVYIGGKIFPSVDQTPGNYAGSIILTVAYTGT